MFIRRTTIKSRKTGKPYYTYRLVESERTIKGVRQRTLINLGVDFPYPRDKWPEMASRIEDIIRGQRTLFKLSEELESACQYYAASILQSQNHDVESSYEDPEDYRTIDITSLEMMRPRSVGIEHVSYEALRQLHIDVKLKELGFNKYDRAAAIGTVIARMVEPGSELSSHYWLQNISGLGELTGYDYEKLSLTKIYKVSDSLLGCKNELEQHLYEYQRAAHKSKETITLYDLTNTYFEGSAKANPQASNGKSKEKRSDCPLVTLGLVLDGSGFPIRSKVFAGNASEPKTMVEMIKGLDHDGGKSKQMEIFTNHKPIIVMDAGIATEDNIKWLKGNNYKYLVVSRKRHKEFSDDCAQIVKQGKDCTVRAYKKKNYKTGEIELYCHSTRREEKEKAIQNRFSTRFESAMEKLNLGLNKKGCVKKYDKIIERIGRLKQRYSKAAKQYEISVSKDKKTGNAIEIKWLRVPLENTGDTFPGVYCLRTNEDSLDEKTLWKTYTMLTDLEAVFRSLKSELGLRPVFHQKQDRVNGHLFITLIAFHVVQYIRFKLKYNGIHSSWSSLRKQLSGQNRTTITMRCKNNDMIHIRKSSYPEPRQKEIYNALGISSRPGRIVKRTVASNKQNL